MRIFLHVHVIRSTLHLNMVHVNEVLELSNFSLLKKKNNYQLLGTDNPVLHVILAKLIFDYLSFYSKSVSSLLDLDDIIIGPPAPSAAGGLPPPLMPSLFNVDPMGKPPPCNN